VPILLAVFLFLPGGVAAQAAPDPRVGAATHVDRGPSGGPAAADSAAIRATALDYIDGWYTGDAERMQRALHPDLAKRIVHAEAEGPDKVDHMGASQLVDGTRQGFGSRTPEDQRQEDVTILDVFGNAASVKVVATDWIDYLHMGKVDGRWVIVNVLWEMKPDRG